jgi:hypothetical protein
MFGQKWYVLVGLAVSDEVEEHVCQYGAQEK